MNTHTQIVILAAGQGKRMEVDIPKALVEVSGKPMVHHIIESVQKFTSKLPISVVGYRADTVKNSLGEKSLHVFQEEQKGTGHAVQCTVDMLLQDTTTDTIIVLYGDQPFVSDTTLAQLSSVKKEKNAKIVIATAVIEDDDLFEHQFYNFGRIIRDDRGVITQIVERKDATDEQALIREVNPAYFCMDKEWMIACLSKLENNNAQGEYYLTDLVKMAFDQGLTIESIRINQREALGANTKEQLRVLEQHA